MGIDANETWKMFFVFIVITYGVFLWFIMREYIDRIKRRKKRFFTVLVNGLRLSTINSLSDVVNLYKSIFRPGVENPRRGLNGALQEFLVKLLEKDLTEKIEEQEIIEWKKVITEYIAKNEEVSPFYDLPDTERTILNDMTSFLEKNDIASVQRKMKELAQVIKTKQEHLENAQKSNKWSIPLAVIGLILTVIFGVASFK